MKADTAVVIAAPEFEYPVAANSDDSPPESIERARARMAFKAAVIAVGGPTAMCRLLGTTIGFVTAIISGSSQIPLKRAIEVEVATDGRFRAEHLRPDLRPLLTAWRRNVVAQSEQRAAKRIEGNETVPAAV